MFNRSIFSRRYRAFIRVALLAFALSIGAASPSQAGALHTPVRASVAPAPLAGETAPPVHIRIGAVVVAPPRGHVRVTAGRTRYHYHGGVFYRPHARGYRVVAAPVGVRVRHLPASRTVVRVGRSNYYYAHGTFYQWHRPSRRYVVVRGPVGATVSHLPAGYATVRLGRTVHYRIGSTYYRPVVRRGVTVYAVVRV